MAIKIYKPTTPGRRGMSSVSDVNVSKKIKPLKKLTRGTKKKGGRAKGKVSIRHRGGGHKKKIRQIDFERLKFDMKAKVIQIEYDSARSAYIARVTYEDGEKRYFLAWKGIKKGQKVISSKRKIEVKSGNRMPLCYLQPGTFVYNIALRKNGPGKIVRSAGTAATLMGIENKMAQIKLPSGEIRLIPEKAMATVGEVSRTEHRVRKLGKAGRKRWLGRRPKVRGKAMGVNAHPHGGGEGRSPIGLKHPKTLWGKPARGVKTRKKHKHSDKYIIKRRK